MNVIRKITVGVRGFSKVVEGSIGTLEYLGIPEEESAKGAVKAEYFRDNIDGFIASTKSKFLKADYSNAVDLDQCIRYSGKLTLDGYARTEVRQTVFEWFKGRDVRHGYELDHACCVPGQCKGGVKCPHRACVNGSHFHEMKQELNVITNNNHSKATFGTVVHKKPQVAKSRCSKGHRMTKGNTREDGKCRACNNLQQEHFRTRLKADALAEHLALDPIVLATSSKFRFTAAPKVTVTMEDEPVDEFELFNLTL